MIKYLGSKRTLIPAILEALGPCNSVLDLFSGTSRVGQACKAEGKRVVSVDYASYAHTVATAHVQADRSTWEEEATKLIRDLNALPGNEGWFTETFCQKSRFLQPFNGARVDAIRESIAGRGLHPELEAIALTSLVEAADRVDSTVGLQMAYLKDWAPRSYNPLTLTLPTLYPGKDSLAVCMDAREAAPLYEVEGVYLDPPYNQHSYLGNYHVWESLVRWDKPEVYGKACKRVDVKTRRSPFNSRVWCLEAFKDIVSKAKPIKRLVVSFSDEAFLNRAQVEEVLGQRGEVTTLAIPYKRHVGASIGIHNPQGEAVGKPGKRSNLEYLFVVQVG